MTSSKLSRRRATAKKPGICVSIPPDQRFSEAKALCRIIWNWTTEPPTSIVIDDQQILDRHPAIDNRYEWYNPAPVDNSILSIVLIAPLYPEQNAIFLWALDNHGDARYADAYFSPGQPPPFSQDVILNPDDGTPPGTVVAQIRPCPV